MFLAFSTCQKCKTTRKSNQWLRFLQFRKNIFNWTYKKKKKGICNGRYLKMVKLYSPSVGNDSKPPQQWAPSVNINKQEHLRVLHVAVETATWTNMNSNFLEFIRLWSVLCNFTFLCWILRQQKRTSGMEKHMDGILEYIWLAPRLPYHHFSTRKHFCSLLYFSHLTLACLTCMIFKCAWNNWLETMKLRRRCLHKQTNKTNK